MASRIAGITVEINGNVTGLQKSLESVNKSIKTTQTELKDVERLLKLDPKNTELLSQKQEKLAANIKNTKEKLDALKTAQEQAKQQLESGELGKDKYEALQREIIATEEELKKLAKEAADTNTALSKIESVGKTLESVGGKMSSVGSTLTKTVTAPIVGIGTAAVKTTADFDASMSNVAAISGATGKDFDSLRDKAREMGAKTKFSASEAADAMSYMAMAGWKTGDMLDGIEGIMYLAAASGEDLATSSDIVTDALTAMGYSAADSGRLADIMAAASSNANTNVSLMGETFKYAAAVAGSYGYSMEDVALATGLMANAGIKGTQSGTALRSIMSRLATDAGASSKSLGALGILTEKLGVEFYNADGSMRPFRDVIMDTRKAWSGLTQEEQANYANKIAGKNAMSGWLALMNASEEDVNKLTNAIDNSNGAAEDMANIMQDNLTGQLTILKSQLEELAISIGDALMPTIRNIVTKVQEFVDRLNSMDEGTRNAIIRFALFAAAIGPVLLVVGKLTTGVGKALQNIAAMGKGILNFVNQAKLGVGAGGKFASAIAAIGPAGFAVIAVVAALAAAFVHLWKNNEEFRDKVTQIWSGVQEKFSAAAAKITEAINALGFDFGSLGEAISAAWDWFCNALAPIVTGVIEGIASVLSGLIDIVTGIIQVICGIIVGFKDGDWSLFLDGLKSIWEGVWNVLSAPVKAVIEIISGYIEAAGTTWGEIWNGVKEFFTNIWNGIRDFFVGLWSGIVSTVTGIVQGLSDFFTTIFTGISDFFTGIWQGISDFFTGIWNGISTTVTGIVTSISEFFTEKFTAISEFFSGIWTGITEFISSSWETIKNVVQVGIMFIGELISAAFQIITIPFQFIWENCKDTIIAVWDFISEKISTVLDAIKGFIETAWNAIVSFLTPVVEGIRDTVVTAWETLKTGVETAVNAVKSVIETVWNGIVSFLSPIVEGIKNTVVTAWETISTTVSGILDGIKSFISEKWEAIKTSVSTTVDNIKTAVSEKWDSIKEKVSGVMDTVKQNISEKWEAAKEKVGSVIDTLKTNVGTKWDSIKEKVTTVSETIKTQVGNKWDSMKTAVGSKVDSMKTNIGSKFDSIKSTVSSKVDSIKSRMETGWNNCLSATTRVFGNIKSKIDSIMNQALNVVGNLIQRIRNKFNFSWSLPKLKLPHISISGSFSINPPRVPHFSISWYKKAMEDGMILNSPTIFGMKGSSLLAGGEAGSETVVGTESLLSMIKTAVASMSGGGTVNYGGVNINVYAAEGQDEMEIAQNVADIIKNQVGREAAVWA